jgi:hypothetical protein
MDGPTQMLVFRHVSKHPCSSVHILHQLPAIFSVMEIYQKTTRPTRMKSYPQKFDQSVPGYSGAYSNASE